MMNTGCVDYLYITEVNQEFPEADVFFPEVDEKLWKKEKTGEAHGQEGDDFDVDFYVYKNAKFY
jgi:dihydrofolate reductase